MTEQVAIYIYLADLFPQAGLAPALDDVRRGPYLLGDRMTAADILWGVALTWMMMFGLVPKKDVFVRYAERITSRPAFQRINAADDEMAAQHAAAAAGG